MIRFRSQCSLGPEVSLSFSATALALMMLACKPAVAAVGSISQAGTGDSHSCVLTTGGGVQCWGNNQFGQLGDGANVSRNLPVNVTGLEENVVQLSVGGQHTCALLDTGVVKCWGMNSSGQLGDASFDGSNLPVGVVSLSEVLSIAAGFQHTCALTSSGAAWCWGNNQNGQLGDDSTSNSNQPVQVAGAGSDLQAISAGEYHSCGLDRSGGVHCWGQNEYGQLGNGLSGGGDISDIPVAVIGLESGVRQVSAGGTHTCAVSQSGAAQCWGRNEDGQLGDSSFSLRSLPVGVTGLGSGVAFINSGYLHTCAVTNAGEGLCWGYDAFGQLGNSGDFSDSNVPVSITGLDAGVRDISANDNHTCAMLSGGGMQCWGLNSAGQLGTGNFEQKSAPVNVQGLNGLVTVVAGDIHACAINTNGGLQCWGDNVSGQLGNEDTEDSDVPVLAAGFHSGIRAMAGGADSTCVITDEGAALCWGDNTNGKLGNSSTLPSPTPVAVAGLGSGVTTITVGANHACAVQNGAAYCWGNGNQGQLGHGVYGNSDDPVAVTGLGSGVKFISAGLQHSCALLDSGGVRCWGDNAPGQLGDGTNADSNVPVTPTGITNAIDMSTGRDHTCAVLTDQTVRCWGRGTGGQLGQAVFSGSASPVTVLGLSAVVDIELGRDHSCALLEDGTARCWGDNGTGRLGNGGGGNQSVAVTVIGLNNAHAITAGNDFSCAAISNGEVHCWGSNSSGQLGRPGSFSNVPVAARGFNNLRMVDSGLQHTCRVNWGGAVACWGYNEYGQVGNGGFDNINDPAVVAGLGVSTAVAAGFRHSCALGEDFTVRCWGDNATGQLGQAAGGAFGSPIQVPGITEARMISAGLGFSCAQTSNSNVQCWGVNADGQLGNGSGVDTHVPVPVTFTGSPAFGTADHLVSGYNHSCAVKNDVVYCWGNNQYGQLGVGDYDPRLSGTAVAGVGNVLQLSAGGYHTCALIDGGTVKCWGRNFGGQLGNGNFDQANTPQNVSGLTDVVAIATGSDHTCAVTIDNALKCWGWNGEGQLGDQTTSPRNTPGDVPGMTRGIVAVDGGEQHTCAISDTGILRCWGGNMEGQLGDFSNVDRSQWVDVFPVKQSTGFTPPKNADSSQPLFLSGMTTSGLDPAFDSWTDSKCSVAGDVLTPLAQGYCGVWASQQGNSEYAAAPAELRQIFILIENIFSDGFESDP
jgi:alpha-tubulin suppressor-like RCC1 family protein